MKSNTNQAILPHSHSQKRPKPRRETICSCFCLAQPTPFQTKGSSVPQCNGLHKPYDTTAAQPPASLAGDGIWSLHSRDGNLHWNPALFVTRNFWWWNLRRKGWCLGAGMCSIWDDVLSTAFSFRWRQRRSHGIAHFAWDLWCRTALEASFQLSRRPPANCSWSSTPRAFWKTTSSWCSVKLGQHHRSWFGRPKAIRSSKLLGSNTDITVQRGFRWSWTRTVSKAGHW